ncbi:succinate dehydrogenase, hydrophobic membrane anchor protein [Acidocella sp.]|uniref:succinate dehydrogenase, hydrophobic membrane anchor protein n=1 Tax=Acidocella sp. TaxID=50710 RepID=UPI00262A345E|nr:succinate dehydrogenase, hydrophobic membrane anchor protein [Acidocella sp.]
MSSNPNPSVHIRRSPLGRAKGLGAAKTGSAHWWAERVSAVALIPLTLYVVFSVVALGHADAAGIAAYMALPWNAVLFIAFAVTLYHHIGLGLTVVIEDYVRPDAQRLALTFIVKAGVILLGLLSVVSILKLAL